VSAGNSTEREREMLYTLCASVLPTDEPDCWKSVRLERKILASLKNQKRKNLGGQKRLHW
jgi:hypothetical protein